MRFSKLQMILVGAAAFVLTTANASSARSLSSDCIALQGGTYSLASGSGIGALLNAGETVTVNLSNPSDVIISRTIGGASIQTTSGTAHSFTVPTDGEYWWKAVPGATTAHWNCTNIPPAATTNDAAELASAAATIAATSQHNMMVSATSRVASDRLLQRGGAGVTSRSLFVSTLSFGDSRLNRPEYNLWISGGYTSLDGGLDGHSVNMLLGMDRLFGENFLAGLMLAYGRTDLAQNGIESEVRSPAVGTYFARRFRGDLLLDGFLAFAKPKVKAGGGSVTG